MAELFNQSDGVGLSVRRKVSALPWTPSREQRAFGRWGLRPQARFRLGVVVAAGGDFYALVWAGAYNPINQTVFCGEPA
jgi:hypothetical protein